MDKDVLDKIIDTAKKVFQDGTPIEKQIQFCETMIGILDNSIPDWFLGQGFDTYERIYHSGAGNDFDVNWIKPCWSDFVFYIEAPDFMQPFWYIGSRDDSDYRFGNFYSTDALFFDFVLYDVFRNEKERLEQIKGVEDFKQQLDDVLTQTLTSTPEAEITQPKTDTGTPNPILDSLLYKFRNEKERLEQIKGIEDFKQQLDDVTAEITTTSTPEIETTPEAEITPEAIEPILPKELDTPYFRNVIEKAIDAGFVKKIDNSYKWIGTRSQLAYFGQIAQEKNNHTNKWKPIETMFGYSNLAQENWKNKEYKGIVPNQNQIDKLFE